jgi:SAM-dependent methyltransferase
VLSHEKFRGQDLDEATREEFFSEGRADIDYILSQIRRIRPEFAPQQALDFGCGVGRLAIPMRELAPRVVGVDVAPSMLASARRNAGLAGHPDIDFLDALPNLQFDWINSYIVFQHIEPAKGYEILAALLERLAKPAVISLHFTTFRDKRVLFRGLQESAFGRFDGQSYVSFERAGLMDMPIYEYDLSRLTFMLNRAGFKSL